MSRTVNISPVTRIEGHLAIHTETEPVAGGHRVTSARCEGEMFRGFETILTGRDPLDAQQITQRICGVCPISHSIASVRAQEMAYGIKPNRNGRLLQNLVFAANYLQSHVLHFYVLAALDFVDVTAVLKYTGSSRALRDLRRWVKAALDRSDVFPAAPFLPRFEADYVKDVNVNWTLLAHYVEALEIRRLAHEMAAVFGAKLPHSTAIVPGGVTQAPTLERVLAYRTRLKEIGRFVEDVYVPDLVTAAQAFPSYWKIGGGCKDVLSYGAFEMDDAGALRFPSGVVRGGVWAPLDIAHITEEVRYSRFDSGTGLHPSRGETRPAPRKPDAYSWLKAPRYQGQPMEVGPLARVLVAYHSPDGQAVRTQVDALLKKLAVKPAQLHSVIGRHLCRGLEAQWLVAQAHQWLDELELGAAPAKDFVICDRGEGHGLTEAPRGALGHWLSVRNHQIERYQCVVPTTWNCSPRDDKDQPGPVEQALTGVVIANPDHPIEPARVVRSFDPCIACAVH
ncbi:MAG TPA: nickel-dependent hydrogenase large subunit [Candidatus Krumholzibacteria bacterium]|nr:nickel-dependent hydrogenase large subunit [Candidatus Krumholzibacteria bacterium]HPD70332.1 nickel-dependent hydrogenase large subunit [Candidatus Krumholzibacteria bacterium]HRY39968.1 nickel-dependent hydrogenase large subunit [Candidatus Krumholzibacteria bacterium]